ncbi:hypothetical protein NC653_021380 [Populus alba x Populus x berolinensis]|uniref:Uncharacterized protein n=1 Tax=Populus alba x Populus x berolinensis TaxID=444605 RepID=A0AAD6MMT2_9ROSI|nr:hypothetical protein NC653_021380 [Populus alba x Populus x berolinensis]
MKDIDDVSSKDARKGSSTGVFSHSFSGNLRPRREKAVGSAGTSSRIAAGGGCWARNPVTGGVLIITQRRGKHTETQYFTWFGKTAYIHGRESFYYR